MRLNGDLGGKFRTEAAPDTIKPTLRLRDVIALTVGIIIGAGIFRTPSLVAGASSSETMMLAVWIIGGTPPIVGALRSETPRLGKEGGSTCRARCVACP